MLTSLCLPFSAFCQVKPGSIEYLKYINGIGELHLGADISTIPGNKLAYLDGNSQLDADSCLTFAYRDTLLVKLNNVLLDQIGIRTYKNKIVNIYLFFPQSESGKLLYKFLVDFGNFTERPNPYKDIYKWNSSNVDLSLLFEVKTDLGIAIFTSKKIINDIETAKIMALKRNFKDNPLYSY